MDLTIGFPSPPPISALDDNSLKLVFEFVGSGHFIFVAPTDKHFFKLYEESIVSPNRKDKCATIFPCTSEATSLLQKYSLPLSSSLCDIAAKRGSVSLLQLLRSMNCPWSGKTCAFAAKYGHLHVLEWLRDNGCPWDIKTPANAIWNGHESVYFWASRRGNGVSHLTPYGNEMYCVPRNFGYIRQHWRREWSIE